MVINGLRRLISDDAAADGDGGVCRASVDRRASRPADEFIVSWWELD